MTYQTEFRPDAWQSFKQRRGRMLLVFGAFFLVVLVHGVVGMATGARLDSEGRMVVAEVIGRDAVPRISPRDQNSETTRYSVALRFETTEGVIVQASRRVSSDLFRQVAGETTAEVIYLPDDPDTLEFEPGRTLRIGRAEALFGGVGLALCLAGLAWVTGRIRAEGRSR